MIFSNKAARQIDKDCLSALKLLRNQVKSLAHFDPVQKHITRYAVVLGSGAIEMSAKQIIVDRVRSGASVEVINYLTSTILRGGMNPNAEKIKGLVSKFNASWCKTFDARLKNVSEKYKGSLKSLVANRNEVAHGKNITVSFPDVVTYYCGARNIIGELEKSLI